MRLAPTGRDRLWLVALAVLFLSSIPLVDPRGEFPLIDDWSFARSARTLFLDHDWRPLGWASMTQLSHGLLGYAVCSVASCSFEHLRFGTLMVGLVLLASSFWIYRRRCPSGLACGLAALGVVFNPVLYPLAYTFMTDVFFALLMLAAAAACTAALARERWHDILLASLALLGATLSRQLGITMGFAFLGLYLLSSEERLAVRCVKAATPAVLCAAVLLSYEAWMRQTGRLPALYDSKYHDLLLELEAPGTLVVEAVKNLVLSSLYLGLFCLPVLLLRPIGRRPEHGRPVWSGPATRWASCVSVAAVILMVRNGAVMPLLGNVLGKGGVGPFTLRDTYILGLPDVPELPRQFWLAVTALSVLGLWLLVFHATGLLVRVWAQVTSGRRSPSLGIEAFGLVSTILYLLPLLPGDLYDRYVAAIAPVLCLSLVPSQVPRGPVKAVALAGGCAASMAVVAILASHDFLAWNRARWLAIASVEAAHEADASTLDGGLEYNGYRAYDPSYVEDPSKSWWWVADDKVMIGFGGMPGTEQVRRVVYRTWLPPDTRSIVVLRRTPLPPAP